jgi:hypothetical protein
MAAGRTSNLAEARLLAFGAYVCPARGETGYAERAIAV